MMLTHFNIFWAQKLTECVSFWAQKLLKWVSIVSDIMGQLLGPENNEPPAITTHMETIAVALVLQTHILQSLANPHKATDIRACWGCTKDMGNTNPQTTAGQTKANQQFHITATQRKPHATGQGPLLSKTTHLQDQQVTDLLHSS